MKILNPLNMYDWPINKFINLIFVIQISLLGLIGLDLIGLKIPVLRELVGFIYLTFIPGILILRILKIHKNNIIEMFLYTVGLSISSLMFLGLFVNMIYPIFGISKPLSMPNVTITITIFVLILSILCYILDKEFSAPNFIDFKDLTSPTFLLLFLMPFLAIFGTYLMNFYDINILLLIIIIFISLLALLASFGKIQTKFHPLTIFIISLTLLYQGWLISMYIWGSDIYSEYYYSQLIITSSYWNWVIPSNTNSMLSITILGPLYYNISNIDLTWIYKIVYPFLFSLVPLGLYQIVKKQTTSKIAFLSSFFFVSTTFFSVWILPFKQELAELFLIILTLILINKEMDKKKASFLFILFGFSLVVSHYGTSYLYIISFVFVLLIMTIVSYLSKSTVFKSKFKIRNNNSKNENMLNRLLVTLLVVFTLSWYIYTSSSSLILTITHIGQNILSNISTDFLSSNSVQGLGYVTKTPKFIFGYIQQAMYLSSSILIVIGVLSQLRSRYKMNFNKEYYTFSFIFLLMLFAALTVPYFSGAIYTQRLYQLTLVFLSPFCIVGGITLFKFISPYLRVNINKKNINSFLNIFSIFIVIFLLFNVGFVDELANTHRLTSVSFSHDISPHKNVYDEDISTSKWLLNNYNGSVYSDITSRNELQSYGNFNITKLNLIDRNISYVRNNVYIFFSHENIVNNILIDPRLERYNFTEISPYIIGSDQIYSSGGSEVIIYKKY